VLSSAEATDDVRDASTEEAAIDDATMEDLFREILAPSPRIAPASLPFDLPGSGSAEQHQGASQALLAPSPTAFAPQVTADNSILGLEELVNVGHGAGEIDDAGLGAQGWSSEELVVDMLEMDRILGMLPAADAAVLPQGLEDLGLWGDMESLAGGENVPVGVF
jgi:hypothetical protein